MTSKKRKKTAENAVFFVVCNTKCNTTAEKWLNYGGGEGSRTRFFRKFPKSRFFAFLCDILRKRLIYGIYSYTHNAKLLYFVSTF